MLRVSRFCFVPSIIINHSILQWTWIKLIVPRTWFCLLNDVNCIFTHRVRRLHGYSVWFCRRLCRWWRTIYAPRARIIYWQVVLLCCGETFSLCYLYLSWTWSFIALLHSLMPLSTNLTLHFFHFITNLVTQSTPVFSTNWHLPCLTPSAAAACIVSTKHIVSRITSLTTVATWRWVNWWWAHTSGIMIQVQFVCVY